jgi:hypothetical protein
MAQIPGEIVSLYIADKVLNPDEQVRDLYLVEYINSLEASGIPCHLLHLNKGCIVMCLRNVIHEAGCCNGTRMIVNDVKNNNILRCTIIKFQESSYDYKI